MKNTFANGLRGLCAALLVTVLVIQFRQSARFDQLEEQQVAAAAALNQQTAVVHRALGSVIPMVLPPDVSQDLAVMEARVADKKTWPDSPAEANALLVGLRDTMRKIPAWAEEDYLPRLNVLRWGLSGLDVIAQGTRVPEEELAEFVDRADDLLESIPDGASQPVAERIAQLQVENRGRLAAADRAAFLTASRRDLERTRSESSAVVRQYWLGKLLDSVVAQSQALAEDPKSDEAVRQQLSDLSTQIEKEIRSDQSRKVRAYQERALTRISAFKRAFEESESKSCSFRSMRCTEAHYAAIKEAMVTHLLPISAGALDDAVARLYAEAFDQGWKALDNKKDLQTAIAQQEAVVEKSTP